MSLDIKFSHIHCYVDHVADVNRYKDLEVCINDFHDRFDDNNEPGDAIDVYKGSQLWKSMADSPNDDQPEFTSNGRDLVKQLIAGFGFRVTGCYPDTNASFVSGTKSVLVTAKDPNGVQILVSSLNEEIGSEHCHDYYLHFDSKNIRKFYNTHAGRQGIAVLAFEVGWGGTEEVFKRYSRMHPDLLPEEYKVGPRVYDGEVMVLEVFAYYEGEKQVSDPDEGTRLRFLEIVGDGSNLHELCKLPGIAPVHAKFNSSCHSAYFDHWVSNVVSRTGFLDTLEDTLQFTPKVDFNAGVVAAGEAQIESTVTGNSSMMSTTEKDVALKDQSQIYLPINNALTEVGHVHGFLEEIGQGVQHIASRVDDIISFVQQANDYRKIFNEGFTFLNIPRSYYGVLTKDMLVQGCSREKDPKHDKNILTPECAAAIFDVCVSENILHADFSVDVTLSRVDITKILDSTVPSLHMDEYSAKKEDVVDTILRSRYVNLYNLLKEHLTEESYLGIVKNKILVDVQGEDLLFQIFTSNILQRTPGEESPFFEFIQRVCSSQICSKTNKESSSCFNNSDVNKPLLKPGCGGFGIRNFLTLFLSIEVTKSMLEASRAKEHGDSIAYENACRKTQILTDQLNESNPILTEISDAMTAEGVAKEKIAELLLELEVDGLDGDESEEICYWKSVMEKEAVKKMAANEKLMDCNSKYQRLMKKLRESLV
mmetsp:Transcript_21505/g.45143  ORF Transcript_21505/g.45143 Transcript_21505/m.45143 type:complete len:707 (-) Transcript_21505:160-2280(-)